MAEANNSKFIAHQFIGHITVSNCCFPQCNSSIRNCSQQQYYRQVKKIRLNSLSLWQLPPTETQAPTHPGRCSVTCIWKIYDVQTLQMSHDSKTLCDAPRGACLDQFVLAVFTSSALSGFMWWFNCTHKCFPLNITKCFLCFMSEVRNAVKHNATSLLVFGLMSECQSQLAVQLKVVEFMWSGPKWADWLTISHTDSTAKELRYWFNSVAKLSILPCESLGRNALLERRLVAKSALASFFCSDAPDCVYLCLYELLFALIQRKDTQLWIKRKPESKQNMGCLVKVNLEPLFAQMYLTNWGRKTCCLL